MDFSAYTAHSMADATSPAASQPTQPGNNNNAGKFHPTSAGNPRTLKLFITLLSFPGRRRRGTARIPRAPERGVQCSHPWMERAPGSPLASKAAAAEGGWYRNWYLGKPAKNLKMVPGRDSAMDGALLRMCVMAPVKLRIQLLVKVDAPICEAPHHLALPPTSTKQRAIPTRSKRGFRFRSQELAW